MFARLAVPWLGSPVWVFLMGVRRWLAQDRSASLLRRFGAAVAGCARRLVCATTGPGSLVALLELPRVPAMRARFGVRPIANSLPRQSRVIYMPVAVCSLCSATAAAAGATQQVARPGSPVMMYSLAMFRSPVLGCFAAASQPGTGSA